MPERPFEVGNPVLSVSQTDIIYYGSDLQDYLENAAVKASNAGRILGFCPDYQDR
jgi:hypothetical protein